MTIERTGWSRSPREFLGIHIVLQNNYKINTNASKHRQLLLSMMKKGKERKKKGQRSLKTSSIITDITFLIDIMLLYIYEYYTGNAIITEYLYYFPSGEGSHPLSYLFPPSDTISPRIQAKYQAIQAKPNNSSV